MSTKQVYVVTRDWDGETEIKGYIANPDNFLALVKEETAKECWTEDISDDEELRFESSGNEECTVVEVWAWPKNDPTSGAPSDSIWWKTWPIHKLDEDSEIPVA